MQQICTIPATIRWRPSARRRPPFTTPRGAVSSSIASPHMPASTEHKSVLATTAEATGFSSQLHRRL
ncbi:unnamed protein product [Linum trigynum]|uniref:Uncharacterized protein n=1 Tax=Linum trigynum TaxID=586398 RepID=A0AAV2DSJ2_9ROSI